MPAIATSRMLWMAIFSSSVIVFLAGWLVRPTDISPGVPTLAVLGMAAIASPITGIAVVRMTFRVALRSLNLKVKEVPTAAEPEGVEQGGRAAPLQMGGYRGASLSRKIIDDPEAPARVLRLYNTAVILGLGFGEVPALMGLVARTMGARMEVALAMTTISWIAIGLRFPTKAKAFAAVEDVYEAKLVELGQG